MIFQRSLPHVVAFVCLATVATGASLLPTEEMDALRQIAETLGMRDWNVSRDPCRGEWNWVSPDGEYGPESNVTCTPECSPSNASACHIISIALKGINLQGKLPPELTKLPYLQYIDLTRTYLNGSIPREWGSMNLVSISILASRVTGPIPKELGKISTLEILHLEFNQLSGNIPPELGDLPRIKEIHLTSNNLTGELPGRLAYLSTLEEFRIGDNNFTGKIPDFIQKWKNLTKLVIQGSGLDGPIPSSIALLENLSDLRISDLKGEETFFPNLSKMIKMKTLILRSCNISGELPDYLENMANLKTLDLSFNKLTGKIPRSFRSQKRTDNIYLTGNLLSEAVPDWMQSEGKKIDLSYNNLTFNGSQFPFCQQRELNLFSSYSGDNASGLVSCLRNFNCPSSYSHFHINCGGEEVNDDKGNTYKADEDSAGPSSFYRGDNWALSSTGHFLDDNKSDTYIYPYNSTLSGKNPELYKTARLSPLSLTYYMFCLKNGIYNVSLHFAEIMFTDDKTYRSLGRRLFDIYIQRELEEKDFNIAERAGGVGRPFILSSTANVTDGTLEIRFYWAGKGTTGIPERGTYGPLISAISVDSGQNGNGISAGTVVGIVAVVAFVIFLALGFLWWKGCLPCYDTVEQNLKGLDLYAGSFTLRQIKAATNNFDSANKIGEGGFGPVYKGILSDGTTIAVKQLSSKSKQGNREFLNEVGMISALQHPHLVKLYGCCIEGDQLLLVYEYMENNSLAHALFGPEECQLKLDWPTRHKICIGIGRGLAFLHEESRLKIVHRDIKATNVLLDKHLNPKISDFGLAKLDEEDDTHISTRIAGTYGYMAPEYAMRGHLTDKADVYSFGVVALEIVSGRTNTSYRKKGDCFYLLDWALTLKEKGNLLELVDPRLGSDFNEEEAMVMIKVAFLCTDVSLAVRPTMSSVVSMLEGRAAVQELVPSPSVSSGSMKFLEMKNPYLHSHETSMSDSLIKSVSTDGPWIASSSSGADLYPVKLESDYWVNRN